MFDLKRLEYRKVLRLLADFCVSVYSKEKVQKIRPTGNSEKIEQLFGFILELRQAFQDDCVFTQPAFHSVGDCLSRAAAQHSSLNIEDFMHIRENLHAASTLKRQCEKYSDEVPLLLARIKGVIIPTDLQEAIDRAVDSHGTIKEDATARLEEIHTDLRRVRSSIENLLGLYLNDPEMRRYFQERHITLKEDRYVVPLKQNFKGRIPGVVHAHSGSDKTVFVEPFSVVDSNNELRRLNREREREIHRILVALTAAVRRQSDNLRAVQDALSDFDILVAKSRFMEELSCTIPDYIDERRIELRGARHPLIREDVVPIDFTMGDEAHAVVITGPNTGGKTVALKTLGLMVMLGQSGIPVPAAYMRTCVFDAVFSDMGDESSIEQSLSTFSAHLVLIDELGAGTDPTEGGALGTAILDYLLDRKIMTVVTTHFSFIKMHALGRTDAEVASVEFDPVTCRPTYRLVMGVPGRSNALEVAGNLGLEAEILDRSREYIGDEAQSMDGIFKRLAAMEQELSRREQEVLDTQGELDRLMGRYRESLSKLNDRQSSLGSEIRQEFNKLLQEYRKRLEHCIKHIREEEGSRTAIVAARDTLEAIQEDFSEFAENIEGDEGRELSQAESVAPEDLEIGDFITVGTAKGGAVQGTVVQLSGDRVTLLAGSLRLTADLNRVQGVIRGGKKHSHTWDFAPGHSRPRMVECDIRGMRYEEAMDEVNRFVDNAVLNNLDRVFIIHGLGTGVLREGVQKALHAHRDVSHFEYARPEQGGFGCTIVQLRR
jgi:DNA mismatch repair protein MutS2